MDSQNLRVLVAQGLNWDAFLDLADNHGLQGLVANRLAEIEFSGVPDSAHENLQARMRAQHVFTLSMTAELLRILQEFSVAEVDTVLVKGPVTSLLAYDDPAVRNYVDLDLLVRHRDIAAASQRMLALGFTSDVPQTAIHAGKIPGEYLFRRQGAKCIVELHTEHTFRYYPKPMLIETLFAGKTNVLMDERQIPALSLEDEFVLDCIHGAKHFWERLMWVADIAAIVARHAELRWDKAKRSAAEVGAERMLHVALRLAASVLGVKIPAAIAAEAQNDQASASLCHRVQRWLPYAGTAPPPLLQRAKFRMDMAGGGLMGAAYLARLSLSPTQEDWAEGAEERRSWFWDAMRRPMRLFRKYGSND